jgi:VanZ family protein
MAAHSAEMTTHDFARSPKVRKATSARQSRENGARPKVKSLSEWLPVILLTLLIFWLSSRPYTAYFAELEGSSHQLFRKYLQYPAHLLEYAVLGLLWIWPLSRHVANSRRAAWLTLGAVMITALLDESIQWFVPTRHFAFRDLLIDSAGGVAATMAYRWMFPATGRGI